MLNKTIYPSDRQKKPNPHYSVKSIFYLTFSLLFLSFGFLNAQSPIADGDENRDPYRLPEIIMPSPTVGSLMKMEKFSLKPYTGQPNISIPLFQKNINGLKFNLYLQYHVSGIRNAEHSGWVGTGWALNAGGTISRTVMGLPDDVHQSPTMQGVNYNNYFAIKNVHDNDLNASLKRKFWYQAQYRDNMHLDYEQDIYKFNFFGHTGKFIFPSPNSPPKIIGSNSHLKIEAFHHNNDNRAPINRFKITDQKGYIYTFSAIETTKTSKIILISPQGKDAVAGGVPPVKIPTFRSAWKLEKVEDSNGNRLLKIYYQTVSEEIESPANHIHYSVSPEQITAIKNFRTGSGLVDCETAINLLRPSITTWNSKRIKSKKISTIKFHDGIQLAFKPKFSKNHPEYKNGGEILYSIAILQANTTNKIYKFHYDQDLKTQKNLLFLNSINFDDTDYQFHYKDKQNLFPFGDENFTQDDFGYYKSGNILNQEYRTEAASGALDTITYPTGGKRAFEWETNTFSFKGDKLITREEALDNPDNYSVDWKTYNLHCDQGSTEDHNTRLLNIPIDQNVEFSYSADFTPQTQEHWLVHIIPNDGGNEQHLPIENSSNNGTIHLKSGSYHIYFQNIMLMHNHAIRNLQLSFKIKHINYPLNWYKYGGGVRIASITDSDQGHIQKKKIYNYQLENSPEETPDTTSLGSGGITIDPPGDPSNPSAPQIRYSSGSFDGKLGLKREYAFTETPYRYPKELGGVHYQVKEELNNSDSQLTNGSYIGYKNVTEYRIKNGGDTEAPSPVSNHSVIKYTYDSPIDNPLFPNPYGFPFPPQTDRDYKRGNLRIKKIFNRIKISPGEFKNRLIKKNSYSYNFDNLEREDFETFVTKTYHNVGNVHNQWYGKLFLSYENYIDFALSGSAMNDNLPCFAPGPLDRYEIPIGGDAPVTPPTKREINYKVHLTRKKTTEYFYGNQPQDNSSIQTLVTYQYSPDNDKLSQKKTLTENDTYRTKYYYTNDSFPGYNSTIIDKLQQNHMINEILAIEDFKNQKMTDTKINRYSLFGPHLVKLKKVQSLKTVPSGGSGDTGDLLEDRLTYHGYDSYGNPLEVSKTDGTHISYIWGYNNTLPVAEIVNATIDDIKNILGPGYDPGSGSLTQSQQQLLRSQLHDAQVTTYTYAPLKGITSVTDPRGRTTTYEYDSSNRLKNIKDNEDNLLKHYKYHYRPQ